MDSPKSPNAYDVSMLLSACTQLAPTSEIAAAFRALYTDLVRDGVSWDKKAEILAGALFDGLRAGNWPE